MNLTETVNRDTRTAGATKGFILKRAAVERYYLTSEYRSMFHKQLRMMVGCGMSHHSHPDLQMPRITRDEADVQSIVRLFEDDWMNPFDPRESEFVSISTGTFPPPDKQETLMLTRLAQKHMRHSSGIGLKTKAQRPTSMIR